MKWLVLQPTRRSSYMRYICLSLVITLVNFEAGGPGGFLGAAH